MIIGYRKFPCLDKLHYEICNLLRFLASTSFIAVDITKVQRKIETTKHLVIIPSNILKDDIKMTQLIYPSCRIKRKENDQRPQRITKPKRSASKPKAVARADATAILNVDSKICGKRKRRGGGIDPFEGRGGHDRVIIWYLYSHKIFQNKNYFGQVRPRTVTIM